ncbi:FkbM family methyltransferase [Neoaquamicrobium sediminum]|uniref:FkbM family methyltransferase n=1 Tax=Neoaquamicrobium sediminum TaxID=1849104 RepID=UPI0015640388|nr:FkbM family methyltransferase [Mesorhizobium sediminum]NRC56213.1 FkbM family methyltransferase [Mesorhizobium sediminum]
MRYRGQCRADDRTAGRSVCEGPDLCLRTVSGVRAKLRSRFREQPRVTCVEAAADATNGTKTMHVHAELSVTNSLLPFHADSGKYMPQSAPSTEQAVSTVSLDSYCVSEGIDRIDLLKIDTQGFERQVLEGTQGLLSRKAVASLYCEMIFVPVYRGQATFYDLAGYLGRFGYGLYDFYDFVYDSTGQLKWGNAVFRPMQP